MTSALRRLALLLGLLLAMAWPARSLAHNLPYSLATLTVARDGGFRLELRCHSAALVVGLPQGHLTPETRAAFEAQPDAEIARRAELMAAYLREATTISADGRPMTTPRPGFPTVAQIREDARMTLQTASPSAPVVIAGRLPVTARSLAVTFPAELGTVLLKVQVAAQPVATAALAPAQPSPRIFLGAGLRPPLAATFAQYLRLGFTHILPGGLDHILFVLSLFLLAPRWKPLAAQVTAFTVAHSVTLALAVFGLVSLPSRFVETMIAVSIAAMALDNVRTRELSAWRPALVFAFGLLHGMGFASVLRDLGLPRGQEALALVSFNLGIEAGQLAVLALAFAAVGWTVTRPWYRRRVIMPASLAIAAVASVWALQRALL